MEIYEVQQQQASKFDDFHFLFCYYYFLFILLIPKIVLCNSTPRATGNINGIL